MPAPTDLHHAWVERVLDFHMPAKNPQGAAVRLAQGMILWNNTRSHIGQQVKLLQDTILRQTANEPDFEEIKANIGTLDRILDVLDDRLIDKLNALRGTQDAAEKRKLSQEARRIVAEYGKYVAEDTLMNDIDANGFVSLDIKARVASTLDAVMATI